MLTLYIYFVFIKHIYKNIYLKNIFHIFKLNINLYISNKYNNFFQYKIFYRYSLNK